MWWVLFELLVCIQIVLRFYCLNNIYGPQRVWIVCQRVAVNGFEVVALNSWKDKKINLFENKLPEPYIYSHNFCVQ